MEQHNTPENRPTNPALAKYAEQVARIGSPIPMHGIITTPLQHQSNGLGLVILNSGLLHHVGSCCFSVKLARSAVNQGYTSLRYDASGIGDSNPRPTKDSLDRRSVSELRETLDYFESTTGINQFVVMGLCSGAFTAIGGAVEDKRIVGVIQIAGFAYHTPRWYINHYGSRLFSARVWQNVIRRRLGLKESWPSGISENFLEANNYGWDVPEQELMEQQYQRLIERNVNILNIMTSGEMYQYNYEGQYGDMFPELKQYNQFREELYKDATHIITQPGPQQTIQSSILRWLNEVPATLVADANAGVS